MLDAHHATLKGIIYRPMAEVEADHLWQRLLTEELASELSVPGGNLADRFNAELVKRGLPFQLESLV